MRQFAGGVCIVLLTIVSSAAGPKILIDHPGLTARWPFWGDDVAGTAIP